MSDKVDITLNINGRAHRISVEPRKTLGEAIRSCLMFAIQADGRQLRTVEGLANGYELHPLQQAFIDHHGLQCGFCTPGILITLVELLKETPSPTEDEVRTAISGNL